MKDGTTAREEVTAYRRPEYFAYKTGEYTFALKYLATGATGEWWFTPDGTATAVRWTYVFQGKNAFTAARELSHRSAPGVGRRRVRSLLGIVGFSVSLADRTSAKAALNTAANIAPGVAAPADAAGRVA
jgi:SLT domain-containing protein